MTGRFKLWIGLAIATSTAIVIAAVLVLLLWYLQPFQPPNSRMVLHRLQQEQVLDLLKEVGRRNLAGESVQQDSFSDYNVPEFIRSMSSDVLSPQEP